jgi:hypothetical protein
MGEAVPLLPQRDASYALAIDAAYALAISPPDRCARTPRLKNQALLAIRGITLANRAHIAAQCSSVNSSSDSAAISFRPLHSAATMAAPASTS